MRRLLILSLYYRPDLSAGSFRTTALVEALKAVVPDDVAIDVVTTLPSRYQTFSVSASEVEEDGRHTIHRIRVPAHQSQMADQVKLFAQFARQVRRLVAQRQYDLVYATSSRLMTAVLGRWIASRAKAPLYLDLRDIFVDQLGEILPAPAALPLRPVFDRLERWTVARADHVNLVSRGFEPYFRARYPSQSFSFFTNGVDDEFLPDRLETAPRLHRPDTRPLTIVYAGNMGQGQGLHAIVPAVAARLQDRAVIKLIGDGGRRKQLEQAVAEAGLTNVEILPPMPRAALMAEYLSADVLFLHLNDYAAFTKVLPSKIFEYAALGKPIWAGVAGYAATFLSTEVSNCAVFPPCDADAALEAFAGLELQDTPRPAFVERFARASIMREMAADILRYLPSGGSRQ